MWNAIPDEIRDLIVQLALQEPELSPRELAVRFAALVVSMAASDAAPMAAPQLNA